MTIKPRRRRERLVLELDTELKRNLRMIAAAHNNVDMRRQVLADIKTAHQLCHPEIGRLVDSEMTFSRGYFSTESTANPQSGENKAVY